MAALEFEDGTCASLGTGTPLASSSISPDGAVRRRGDGGLLGSRPCPLKEEVDGDLSRAREQTASIFPGAVLSPAMTCLP